jgi:hypothetical protein
MKIHDKVSIQLTLRLTNISGGMTVSVIADAAICSNQE